ncbi:repetitive organellar protein-like isoform X2 [Macrobrachium rosenbergii]|uniref:repetitive organellar protein-like isoform X2 n=1 Tax=Macrobrachium rosenbergii TaxID=79674 RepID=UPI0034D404E1
MSSTPVIRLTRGLRRNLLPPKTNDVTPQEDEKNSELPATEVRETIRGRRGRVGQRTQCLGKIVQKSESNDTESTLEGAKAETAPVEIPACDSTMNLEVTDSLKVVKGTEDYNPKGIESPPEKEREELEKNEPAFKAKDVTDLEKKDVEPKKELKVCSSLDVREESGKGRYDVHAPREEVNEESSAGVKIQESSAEVKIQESSAEVQIEENVAGVKAEESAAEVKVEESATEVKVEERSAEVKIKVRDDVGEEKIKCGVQDKELCSIGETSVAITAVKKEMDREAPLQNMEKVSDAPTKTTKGRRILKRTANKESVNAPETKVLIKECEEAPPKSAEIVKSTPLRIIRPRKGLKEVLDKKILLTPEHKVSVEMEADLQSTEKIIKADNVEAQEVTVLQNTDKMIENDNVQAQEVTDLQSTDKMIENDNVQAQEATDLQSTDKMVEDDNVQAQEVTDLQSTEKVVKDDNVQAQEVTDLQSTEKMIEDDSVQAQEVTHLQSTDKMIEDDNVQAQEVTDLQSTEKMVKDDNGQAQEVTDLQNTDKIIEDDNVQAQEVTDIQSTEKIIKDDNVQAQEVTDIQSTDKMIEDDSVQAQEVTDLQSTEKMVKDDNVQAQEVTDLQSTDKMIEDDNVQAQEVTDLQSTEKMVKDDSVQAQEVTYSQSTEKIIKDDNVQTQEVTDLRSTEKMIKDDIVQAQEVTDFRSTEKVIENDNVQAQEATDLQSTEKTVEDDKVQTQEVTDLQSTEKITKGDNVQAQEVTDSQSKQKMVEDDNVQAQEVTDIQNTGKIIKDDNVQTQEVTDLQSTEKIIKCDNIQVQEVEVFGNERIKEELSEIDKAKISTIRKDVKKMEEVPSGDILEKMETDDKIESLPTEKSKGSVCTVPKGKEEIVEVSKESKTEEIGEPSKINTVKVDAIQKPATKEVAVKETVIVSKKSGREVVGSSRKINTVKVVTVKELATEEVAGNQTEVTSCDIDEKMEVDDVMDSLHKEKVEDSVNITLEDKKEIPNDTDKELLEETFDKMDNAENVPGKEKEHDSTNDDKLAYKVPENSVEDDVSSLDADELLVIEDDAEYQSLFDEEIAAAEEAGSRRKSPEAKDRKCPESRSRKGSPESGSRKCNPESKNARSPVSQDKKRSPDSKGRKKSPEPRDERKSPEAKEKGKSTHDDKSSSSSCEKSDRKIEDQDKKREIEDQGKKRKIEDQDKKRKIEDQDKKRKIEDQDKKRKIEDQDKKRKIEDQDKKKDIQCRNEQRRSKTPSEADSKKDTTAGCGLPVSLKSDVKKSNTFRQVVFLVNSVYKIQLKGMESLNVKVVYEDNLSSETVICNVIQKHRKEFGRNTLWILLAGVYTFVNDEKVESCGNCKETLRIIPKPSQLNDKKLLDYKILQLSHETCDTVQHRLGSDGLITIVPPLPALLALTDNYDTHQKLHDAADGYNLVVAKTTYEKMRKKYNAICRAWTENACERNKSWISVEAFKEYTDRGEANLFPMFSKFRYEIRLKNWFEAMEKFINLVLETTLPDMRVIESLSVSHKSDSIEVVAPSPSDKVNKVVVVGSTSFTKDLQELTKDMNVEHLNENIDFDEDGLEFLNELQNKHPDETLWVVLSGVSEVAAPVESGPPKCKILNCNEPIPVFVTKNDELGDPDFKDMEINRMVNIIVKEAFDFATLAIKKLKEGSALFLTPIMPMCAIWSGHATSHSHEALHRMYKRNPNVPHFTGSSSVWIRSAKALEMKWLNKIINSLKRDSYPCELMKQYKQEKPPVLEYVEDVTVPQVEDMRKAWSKMMAKVLQYYLSGNETKAVLEPAVNSVPVEAPVTLHSQGADYGLPGVVSTEAVVHLDHQNQVNRVLPGVRVETVPHSAAPVLLDHQTQMNRIPPGVRAETFPHNAAPVLLDHQTPVNMIPPGVRAETFPHGTAPILLDHQTPVNMIPPGVRAETFPHSAGPVHLDHQTHVNSIPPGVMAETFPHSAGPVHLDHQTHVNRLPPGVMAETFPHSAGPVLLDHQTHVNRIPPGVMAETYPHSAGPVLLDHQTHVNSIPPGVMAETFPHSAGPMLLDHQTHMNMIPPGMRAEAFPHSAGPVLLDHQTHVNSIPPGVMAETFPHSAGPVLLDHQTQVNRVPPGVMAETFPHSTAPVGYQEMLTSPQFPALPAQPLPGVVTAPQPVTSFQGPVAFQGPTQQGIAFQGFEGAQSQDPCFAGWTAPVNPTTAAVASVPTIVPTVSAAPVSEVSAAVAETCTIQAPPKLKTAMQGHLVVQYVETDMDESQARTLLQEFGELGEMKWPQNKDKPARFLMITYKQRKHAERAERILNYLKVFGDNSQVRLIGGDKKERATELKSEDLELLLSIHDVLNRIKKDILKNKVQEIPLPPQSLPPQSLPPKSLPQNLYPHNLYPHNHHTTQQNL